MTIYSAKVAAMYIKVEAPMSNTFTIEDKQYSVCDVCDLCVIKGFISHTWKLNKIRLKCQNVCDVCDVFNKVVLKIA